MRKIEVIQKNNEKIRLTIAPDRITLKVRNQEEEDRLAKHLDRIQNEFDLMDVDHTKTWRGVLYGTHQPSFHLCLDNKRSKEDLRFTV